MAAFLQAALAAPALASGTAPPVLSAPLAESTTSTPVRVAYELPEAAAAGSVRIIFEGKEHTVTLTLAASMESKGSHEITVNSHDITESLLVSEASAGTIPDGTYKVVISYSDLAKDPPAVASAPKVTLVTATAPPSWITPTTESSEGATMELSFVLPEAAEPGSVVLTFKGSVTSTVTLSNATAEAGTLTLDTRDIAAGGTASTGPTALADGAYTLVISYRDYLKNPVAQAAVRITLDRATPAPTLIDPASGLRTASPVSIRYELPEAAAAGSLVLSFAHGGTDEVVTLASSMASAGEHEFGLPTSNLIMSPAVIAAAPGSGLPDGEYSVSLTYQDAFRDPAATSAAAGVVVQTQTPAPSLTQPAAGATVSAPFDVAFDLPQAPQAGSAELIFTQPGREQSTVALPITTSGAHEVAVDSRNLSASGSLTGPATLTDGECSVTIRYADTLGNQPASSTATVMIDRATAAPSLLAPSAGERSSSPLQVRYDLPEAAGPGTVEIRLEGPGTPTTLTLSAAMGTAGEHALSLDTSDLTAGTDVQSSAPGNSIPDGSYSVLLSYQDASLDPAAQSGAAGVVVETKTAPPTITAPAPGARESGPFDLDYTLPESALAGSITLSIAASDGTTSVIALPSGSAGPHAVTIDPAKLSASSGPTALAVGPYTLTIAYRDALGNPAATASSSLVLVAAATEPPAAKPSPPAPAARLLVRWRTSPRAGRRLRTVAATFAAFAGARRYTITAALGRNVVHGSCRVGRSALHRVVACVARLPRAGRWTATVTAVGSAAPLARAVRSLRLR